MLDAFCLTIDAPAELIHIHHEVTPFNAKYRWKMLKPNNFRLEIIYIENNLVGKY